ncbi:ABC transporter permease [Candidatus Berkelbacteria bacterium]|nr:ABC transporter permease [Candidatus Berkelbacteria bacterium]
MRSNWIGLQTIIRREVERFIRVGGQTLVTPWISALLYIFVFGQVVGQRISSIGGVSYIDFVLPGVLMMNVIGAAFGQSSSSIYFARFARHIEEILVSPLSYFEMIIGFIVGVIARSVAVGLGIYVIAIFFSAATIEHFGLFLFYITAAAIVFGFLGIIVGLWANGFEQLGIWSTFVFTPLTFVGGVFNTLDMLPPALRTLAQWNPFFYFIDGIRYSMIGVREANPIIGYAVVIGSMVILGILTEQLFRRGYGLRS